MAAVTQSRALAGCRMSMQAKQTVKVTNGAKYFMKRRDSYMVEVNVGDTETEDQAVRRYMRAVVQSGVINKLRSRRTKETKIETYKRKLAERAQARKLGIEEPTWDEFYGPAILEEAKPFDEFFVHTTDMEMDVYQELPLLDGGYYNQLDGQLYDLSNYNDKNFQAGYINNGSQDQGGYINQQQQGGYINQQQGGTFSYTSDQLQQQPQQQQ
ncbi:plastid/chloroplast ribosomal protein S21 [Scenedesmus sp. NREL 46B-D3]|nr:plastid/chloroplast ribosomal protein S21 [Scenedesmus sp. NREL 46B-D3]